MGLGPFPLITLADAREQAIWQRKLLHLGWDPITERKNERAERRASVAVSISFQTCADAYVDSHESGWRNEKHAAQWRSTLTKIAGPVIGHRPVAEIDTGLVMRVLEPIWKKRTETASRLRGRIESVLDWASVQGYRQGDNPARWKGHLDKLLPKPSKVAKVKHHASIPFAKIYDFLCEIREQKGVGARCLEFVILTASRTGEAIGARWSEIDLEERIWTIPPERMKAERAHTVPLSDAAIAVLTGQQGHDDIYVFPGRQANTHLSNMAMLELLKNLGKKYTVHGMRSSFRSWAGKCTSYPRDVCEAALAHVMTDKTEESYWDGDAYDKRTNLMNDWASFCLTKPASGKVVSIKAKQA